MLTNIDIDEIQINTPTQIFKKNIHAHFAHLVRSSLKISWTEYNNSIIFVGVSQMSSGSQLKLKFKEKHIEIIYNDGVE